MRPETKKALCVELGESFTEAEFRRFLGEVASDIRHELPTAGSLAGLINEAIDLLERHDRVDARFFDSWRELRPARSSRITELAAARGCTTRTEAEPAPHGKAATPGNPTALADLSPAALACHVGAVVYFAIMIYDARASSQRALLVSGSFLLAVILPASLSRGRLVFVVTLLAGVSLIACGKCLESQRPAPSSTKRGRRPMEVQG